MGASICVGGYCTGMRLLDIEVTVRPAGVEGEGVCVFVCFRGVWKEGGGEILASPIGFVCQ